MYKLKESRLMISFSLCSPGCNWLSGLWAQAAGSCPTFHLPVAPILLNWSTLNLSIPHSVLLLISTQVQDLALGLGELHVHGVHVATTSQASQSLWWNSFPAVNQMHHSACCDSKVHSVPLSISLMQIINNVGPNVDPGGTPLIMVSTWTLSHWLQPFACDHPTTTLLIWQSIIKSINLQFSTKNIVVISIFDHISGLKKDFAMSTDAFNPS